MRASFPAIPAPFLEAARALLEAYRAAPSTYRLPLTADTFGELEVGAVLEALVRGPVTFGPRGAAFEKLFAREHSRPDAVFCNSGSSANLLAVTTLTRPPSRGAVPALRPGDEVVVPAVTWPTTVWPISQTGAVPVLADVSAETLNVTVESVERALSSRTRAIFVTHTLGNPAPVDRLAALCEKRDLVLLEDACEALDAHIDGRKAGTFGRLATFSFYFSHHISTIEGGMVLCSEPADGERVRILRAHGWTRQMSEGGRRAAEVQNPRIDPRFLFVDLGYNLRGTDLQAAIGLAQMARRKEFLSRRLRVASLWSAARDRHADLFLPTRFGPGASPFAFPLVLRPQAAATRAQLVRFLEDRGIETRPLVAGNLARQPAMELVPHRTAGPLEGADLLHERALYVGLHPFLTDTQVEYLPEALDAFEREVVR